MTLLQIQEDRVILGGVRAEKSPKMGYFMDIPSPWKHSKIYNFTTTNAIKMKLSTIVHLFETFHFA